MTTNGKSKVNYDTKFTESVIAAIGDKTDPRLKEIISSLIRHSHGFLRDVNLNSEEFMTGLSYLNWAGQMTDERRNEGLLLTDVLGLER